MDCLVGWWVVLLLLYFTQVDRWTVWSADGLSCCNYILPRLIGGLFGRLVGCLAVTIFYPG